MSLVLLFLASAVAPAGPRAYRSPMAPLAQSLKALSPRSAKARISNDLPEASLLADNVAPTPSDYLSPAKKSIRLQQPRSEIALFSRRPPAPGAFVCILFSVLTL